MLASVRVETKIEFENMSSGGIKRKLNERESGKWIIHFEMLIGGKVIRKFFFFFFKDSYNESTNFLLKV